MTSPATDGEICGFCDAALNLPSQAATRFAELLYRYDRGDEWHAFRDAYEKAWQERAAYERKERGDAA